MHMNDYCPADTRIPQYFQLLAVRVKQLTTGIPDCSSDLCLLLWQCLQIRPLSQKSYNY